jgi:hypothetical protein
VPPHAGLPRQGWISPRADLDPADGFRRFDRHKQRANRFEGDDGALYAGEWFELGQE